MAKFNVGDRVRENGSVTPAGVPGVVLAVNDDHTWVKWDDDEWPDTVGTADLDLLPPDPTEALIAAAYAWADLWGSAPTIGPPGDLWRAVKAHREAQS